MVAAAPNNKSHGNVLSISLIALSTVALISNFLVSKHVFQLGNTDPFLVRSLMQNYQIPPGNTKDESRGRLAVSSTAHKDDTIPENSMVEPNEERIRAELNGLVPLPPTSKSLLPAQNPHPPPSGQDSFAACLLVMDDNHRLVEWMAYHYHVLPLRYLIIAVDPRSRTSPTPILNRYRRMGVYIREWTDHDFLDPKLANNDIPNDARFQVKRDRHRARQKVFYRSCLTAMKDAGRTFVTIHDTDEYLVYNVPKQKKKEQQQPFSMPTPTTADQGAMIKHIRRRQAQGNEYYSGPCISVPRLHFGAVESTQQERSKEVPSGFDAQQFDSFRWRKHSKRDDFPHNNLAKTILDVSRIDMANAPRFKSLHRPIPTICQPPWVKDKSAGLRINHYLGSWESFSMRDDARRGGERSRETWEFQARDLDETDDNIRPWLDGFVQTHGADKAHELLAGAGLPKSYRNRNDTAWRSMWVEDILKRNETEGTNPKNHEFDAFIRRKFQHEGRQQQDVGQEKTSAS